MKKQRIKRIPKRKKAINSLTRIVLTGMILGPAVMLASAALLSLIALNIGNPAENIFPLANVSVFIGGLAAAIYSAKRCKEKPTKAGLLTGLAIIGLMLIIALISSPFTGELKNAVIPPAAVLVSSVIGTILVVRMKPNPKKRLKKLQKQYR
ncbi:MAG TPA: TIGR04086 family membrane protein [Bacillota bacterium]|nr:TIGR04086 family membrane protein [Bacillota bacterium]HPP85715.1 TIGR04086 family membrane protein [Bacillota bacterium]